MAFQVSPGINVSEIDLTTTIPSLATTVGAFGGVFRWGPVGKFILVDSENTLVARYGKPTSDNFETFFTAANFLSYGNALYVSRAAVTTGFSNTVSSANVNLQGNSTVILTGNAHGVAAGHSVFGAGIPAGTFVSSVTANSTALEVTLTTNATSSDDAQLNFFANTLALNAVANSGIVELADCIVKNADDFEDKGASNATFASTQFVARYPGDLGNSLKVSMCDSVSQYSRSIDMFSNTSVSGAAATFKLDQLSDAVISINVNSTAANVVLTWVEPGIGGGNLTYAETKTAANTILQSLSVGDFIELGNTVTGTQTLKIKSLPAVSSDDASSLAYFPITFEDTWNRASNFSSNTIARKWEFFNTIPAAPGTSRFLSDRGLTTVDQVSVVIVDEDGQISGIPGTVLEVYENLSRATDAIGEDGTTAFYKTIINDNSRWVFATNDRAEATTATAAALANSTTSLTLSESFIGGRDGVTESSTTVAALASAYDLFADATTVDVSLIMAGKAVGASNGAQLANYLIDNIADVRKDCVVFVSPQKEDVVGSSVDGSQAANIVTFRQSLRNSSYAFIDSGYKYQYDRYNDVYRYIPLNGDIAGLTARSDDLRDPWFSPAGYSRGQIKNLVKLAYSPSKTDRDLLYKNDINPVITQPGQGTVLFGDKTALGRSSAFDRINVRRLFIVLEKTIATAANQMLFEFNDEFTRSQFLNLIEPFLRDVQGRRGITDFRVVCDETNNTAEVVDRNEFIGDIYIKPARSINFIQLNFVAVRTGVDFTEIVGKF
jgi:phage tail sheath protein FI